MEIVFESLELDHQDWAKRFDFDAFFCILQTMIICPVPVVPLQNLVILVTAQRLLKIGEASHLELQICKSLPRLPTIIYIQTLYVVR